MAGSTSNQLKKNLACIPDIYVFTNKLYGLPWWSDGKVSAYNVGDLGSIPGLGRAPGERNGNHSSILTWKIPWTEGPGGLQSMGLQRVGHDRATSFSLSLINDMHLLLLTHVITFSEA